MRLRKILKHGAQILLALVLAGCREGAPQDYVRISGPAPAVAPPPTGTLLVSFWATWCPPCRIETDHLRRLAAAPPAELAVVVLSQDADDSAIEHFFAGPPDPALHLRLDHGGTLFDAFRIKTLPTSILVVDGQLVARFEGSRNWNGAEIRDLLERLIRGARAAEPHVSP